ncbi:MAG: DNA ligase [Betaproteobacteria bacterium]
MRLNYRWHSAIRILACSMLLSTVAIVYANQPAPILLANMLGEHVDPSLYLVSEKYDGVRAIWDGKNLRFRSGRTVNAPNWFVAKLPAEKLDGELWLARGAFERLSGFVRKTTPLDEDWRQIKYMVFELPDGTGTFADRVARIRQVVDAANWPQLVAVEQFNIADRIALKRKLDQVVRKGGEGLMLHLASAPYVTGRSDVLLKLKPQLDTEAKIVDHIPGKGKYHGQMGALRVEMPDGRRFNIGTGFSDATRKNPPAVGTIITYTYRGLTNKGTPRFASYVRIREEF